MKKQILMLGAAMLFAMGSATFVGCGGTEENKDNHENHEHADGSEHVHATFACPMDCEDGKTYEEAGSCSVCGMDLTEAEG